MKELNINIEILMQTKQDLENKIDDFSRYGRIPNDSDYEKMIEFLNEWDKIRCKINVLKECLNAVSCNTKN